MVCNIYFVLSGMIAITVTVHFRQLYLVKSGRDHITNMFNTHVKILLKIYTNKPVQKIYISYNLFFF